ncbi:hypothetical protein ACFFRR_004282 [Megaselia abdita]
MNSLALCVFLAIAGSAFAAPSTVVSKLPDNLYYLTNLTISENENRINFIEVQVNLTDNRFTHFAESLRYKNKLVSRTLFNGERNLTGIGFLNFTNQECVIHYGKLPELRAVQKTVNDCVDETLYLGEPLLRKVTLNLDQAKKRINFLRIGVENCSTNQTGYKLTDCVEDVIQSENQQIRKILNSADRDFQISLANYDDLAKQAMECTYNVVEGLGKSVENVLRTINECQTKKI